MVSYKLGKKTYRLPLGDIYKDEFSRYTENNVISFDGIYNVNELYRVTNRLFGFVANSLCCFDDDFLADDLRAEKEDIRRRINSVDKYQKFIAQKGDVEKSIGVINSFIIVMLEHYQKLTNVKVPRKGGK